MVTSTVDLLPPQCGPSLVPPQKDPPFQVEVSICCEAPRPSFAPPWRGAGVLSRAHAPFSPGFQQFTTRVSYCVVPVLSVSNSPQYL